ncbi:MAG: putative zinc-binding metallopeptidase, partial [Roseiarcus sp.]
MRLFECQNCHNAVHFDNTVCVNCHDTVGYIQDRFEMTALEPRGNGRWNALADPGRTYVLCDNARHGVCNWLVREGGPALCESCRHNRIIPNLSVPENLVRWQKIELAKRYLFRSLLRWRLPTSDRFEDPEHGLVFDLRQDSTNPDGSPNKVLTGHDEGVITLNVVEADDAERENRRVSMGETYRTL